MTDEALRARLDEVRSRIAAACRRAGREDGVRIVAVTKGHPAAAVQAAVRVGLDDVGENRVQEALSKQTEIGPLPVRWHLIGSLQRNKARLAAGRFALIHSVDRSELVSELARRVTAGTRQAVLVEVNCSGEAQKGGVELEAAPGLVEEVLARPELEFRGLMTMAALTDDQVVQRAAFRRLGGLRRSLESGGISVPELSMGMSGDFEVAVEEGATMVRLGTILFGERVR